jgi:hypothetical protein
MPMPLALTDSQLEQVQDICRVIAPTRRSAFLQLLARRLEGVELGDGAVHRIAAQTMREFVQGGGRTWLAESDRP